MTEKTLTKTDNCQHEGEGYHRLEDPCSIIKDGITRVVSRCVHCEEMVARKRPWLNEWEIIGA